MTKLTGQQRYRQATLKALIIGQRNIRRWQVGEIGFLPQQPTRQCIIEELERAYEKGRSDAFKEAK